MKKLVKIQLLEYPGSLKSALLGMKDIFDLAGSIASQTTEFGFQTEIATQPHGLPDIVIVPPALSPEPPVVPNGWSEKLRVMHENKVVLASVCSGAFVLAETGLFFGRRVTTHWKHATAFSAQYPNAVLDADRLLVDIGDLVSAGGVMSWTDLSLHIVQRFGGRQLMLDTARVFVLDPPKREQSFYARFTPIRSHTDKVIAKVQSSLHETPQGAHTLTSMAQVVPISERSLLRRFKQVTGLTPVTYLQQLRVDIARSKLELTRDSFEQICWDVGYSDPSALRRVFKTTIGLSPSAYRRRFGRR